MRLCDCCGHRSLTNGPGCPWCGHQDAPPELVAYRATLYVPMHAATPRRKLLDRVIERVWRWLDGPARLVVIR